MVNAPKPKYVVQLDKHVEIFKNTREVHREARDAAECLLYN